MARQTTQKGLLRERSAHGHHRVTYVELFFDLVFVFAVTQVSHTLLAHFTPHGVLEVSLLFFAVWWAWVFTSWVTNWLDPERTAVRLMLFALMLGGLVLSTSIPKAFETRALAFALAYVGMQVGRSLFTLWSIPDHERGLKLNFVRISIWLAFTAGLWIAGALIGGTSQIVLWALALMIEYSSPVARFWTPGLGATNVSDWSVEGGHMAERCALFIIIALGESILVTGATFAGLSWTPDIIAAFAFSFLGSIAMWWVYFHRGADAGAERISRSKDPGRLARLAYTYLHLPIVAGIVVAAVGDEVVLMHPHGHADAKAVFGLVGGPLIFLVGTLLFKQTIHGRLQLSHLVGLAALIVLVFAGPRLSPLTLSAATTIVMLVVAGWEAWSLRAETPIEPEI